VIDDHLPFGTLGERVAGVSERREQSVLGGDHRSGARRIARFEWERRRGRVRRHGERAAIGPENLDRGNAIQRSRIGLNDDLDRIGAGVDLIRKLGIPVAEAVSGVLETIEIVFGTAPQCFLGAGEVILERLQL
jgi:hypothetical protein